jgi:hypothetical protein
MQEKHVFLHTGGFAHCWLLATGLEICCMSRLGSIEVLNKTSSVLVPTKGVEILLNFSYDPSPFGPEFQSP